MMLDVKSFQLQSFLPLPYEGGPGAAAEAGP